MTTQEIRVLVHHKRNEAKRRNELVPHGNLIPWRPDRLGKAKKFDVRGRREPRNLRVREDVKGLEKHVTRKNDRESNERFAFVPESSFSSALVDDRSARQEVKEVVDLMQTLKHHAQVGRSQGHQSAVPGTNMQGEEREEDVLF